MRGLTRDWMEAGAVGLNTGLDYQPAANCETDELIALARVVARVRRHLRRAHALQPGGQAGRLSRVDRDRPRGGHPGPALARDGRRRDRAAARRGPCGPASTSASTSTSIRPARATCSSGSPPRTRSAASTRPCERLREDPGASTPGRGAASRSRSRRPTPAAAANTSPTRGPGQHIGRSIAEIAARARHAASARPAVDLIVEESPDALLVFRRGDDRGGLRGARAAHARPPGVHGRQRRHLPRRPAAPARLRPLCAGSSVTFVRELGVRDAWRSGPPDERPAGRALRRSAIAAGSPRAWRPTSSSSTRRPSAAGATWDEPRLPAVGIDARRGQRPGRRRGGPADGRAVRASSCAAPVAADVRWPTT